MKTFIPEKDVRKWFKENRPDIELVEYGGASSAQSRFRCKKCGREWQTTTASVKHGSGCVSCRHRTPEDVIKSWIRCNRKDIVLVKYGGLSASPTSRFRCKKCGHEWMSSVNTIKNLGGKCPECRKRERSDNTSVINWLKNNKPTLELVWWGGSRFAKSKFRCKRCGNEFERTLNSLLTLKGTGCRECARGNEEEARSWLKENLPTVEMLSYGGMGCLKSKFRCTVCGHTWEALFSATIKKKGGCVICSKKSHINSNLSRITAELGKRNIELLKYDGNPYQMSTFRCTECGHIWQASLYHLYKAKSGCKNCYIKRRSISEDKVKTWLNEHRPNIKLLHYSGCAHRQSTFKCTICGHVWDSAFNSLVMHKHCCPHWYLHDVRPSENTRDNESSVSATERKAL